MGRIRMVTRTINVTDVTALCMDIASQQAVSKTFSLTGASYTQEKALKEVQKLYQTEELAIVAIQSLSQHEEIYGMLETDFLKVAKRMTEDRKFTQEEDEE